MTGQAENNPERIFYFSSLTSGLELNLKISPHNNSIGILQLARLRNKQLQAIKQSICMVDFK